MTSAPFAVDGQVTLEKLRETLAHGTEHEAFDFKAEPYTFDRNTKSRADFVKDCAGLMSREDGGYIVLGVDGPGMPVTHTPPAQPYDEANLRGILKSYLDGRFELSCQTHTINDIDVILIYVAPPDDWLPVVFTKVGPVQGRPRQGPGPLPARRHHGPRGDEPPPAEASRPAGSVAPVATRNPNRGARPDRGSGACRGSSTCRHHDRPGAARGHHLAATRGRDQRRRPRADPAERHCGSHRRHQHG